MRMILGTLLLYTAASGTQALTANEPCAQGDDYSCQLVELGKKIDSEMLFGPEGRYRLVLQDRFVPRSGSYFDITARARDRAMITCAVVARAWVIPDVAEFARRQSAEIVERAEYDACMPNATENFRREYTEDMVVDALRYVVAPLAALGALITLFWYRRPLARRMRRAKEKVDSLGAE